MKKPLNPVQYLNGKPTITDTKYLTSFICKLDRSYRPCFINRVFFAGRSGKSFTFLSHLINTANRKAFLCPPHGNSYTDSDFERVNSVLFPGGSEDLEVYRWTTGWSEYFDEGHEWWGALCLTVYDKTLDRFVVIMASATD